MMAMEKEKSKRKKKTSKPREEENTEEEESSASDSIGKRLEEIQRKKQKQREAIDWTRPLPGLRPKDDLTREVAIGPSKPSSDTSDSKKDDDSKHFNEELLSQKSMVVNLEEQDLDGFGNYGCRSSFAPANVQATSIPPAVSIVAQLPPLHTKTAGLAYYGLDPPTQMGRETAQISQLTMSQASQLSLINNATVRAPSPAAPASRGSSRAPSPAVGAAKRSTKAADRELARQKNEREKNELRRLEHLVLNFTYNQRDNLICQEEFGSSSSDNGEKGGDVLVAKYIRVGSHEKNNYQEIDINRFNYDIVRKIAANFGCKNVSAASKFECRRKMALRKTSGTVYNLEDIANPVAEAADKKINTYMRVINACFLPEFFDQFIHLNDSKNRKDYEAAGGGNPIKSFWVEISNTVNDTEHQDVSIIQFTEEDDGDHRIKSLIETGGLKLADFNQTTNNNCSQMMKDVTKAYEKVSGAMKRSGHHCVDMWNYLNRSHLQVRSNYVVPGTPVYYYGLLAKAHPGIEGSWNYCLDESLQSDSTTKPSDTTDCRSTSTVTTSTRKDHARNEILEAIQKTTTLLHGQDSEGRQQLLQAQTKLAEDNRCREQWKEYDMLGQRILDLKDRSGSEQMLRNLARRVHALETDLGIPSDCSIVKEYV